MSYAQKAKAPLVFAYAQKGKKKAAKAPLGVCGALLRLGKEQYAPFFSLLRIAHTAVFFLPSLVCAFCIPSPLRKRVVPCMRISFPKRRRDTKGAYW